MLIFVHPKIFVQCVFWMKMAHLQLGIGAKVSILVSRLHPKNLISMAYANYTKTDKAEGLVVVSEGPKLICQEEKVVIVFCHPPKGESTEEFECWAIHCFVHVSEEGNEQGFFNASSDGGDNNSGGVDGSQQNPNTTPNTTHNNTEEAQTNKPVPVEITQLLESNASISSTLDSNDADLVQQMLPGMVDDDNQPLPENIPTPADEGQESAQFFSNWEHSGSCFCCIEGGRKNKAHLSFNTEMKPTIQELFEMLFFKPYVVGVIIPQTNICLQHIPSVMESFFIGLVCGCSWQQSLVQIEWSFGPQARLIVLLVPP